MGGYCQRLESAMKSDKIRDVRSACTEFLTTVSGFCGVPACGVRVLTARPLRTRERGTFELFGDYAPESMLIRVWMRTAVRKEVTSFGTFVSTLCHEFCHHLDSRSSDSRTRGTHAASTSGRLCSTTTPVERHQRNCSGFQRRENNGGSTGRERIGGG